MPPSLRRWCFALLAGKVEGAVLADQVKSLDWRARKAERIGRAAPEVMDEALAKVAALLGFDD